MADKIDNNCQKIIKKNLFFLVQNLFSDTSKLVDENVGLSLSWKS